MLLAVGLGRFRRLWGGAWLPDVEVGMVTRQCNRNMSLFPSSEFIRRTISGERPHYSGGKALLKSFVMFNSMPGNWFLLVLQSDRLSVPSDPLTEAVSGQAHIFCMAVVAIQLVHNIISCTGVVFFDGVIDACGLCCKGVGGGMHSACFASGSVAWVGPSGFVSINVPFVTFG